MPASIIMKFQYVPSLLQQIKQISIRFPAEIFFAGTGTIMTVTNLAMGHDHLALSGWMARAILASTIGFLLSLSVSLYGESNLIHGVRMRLFKASAAVAGMLSIFVLNPEVYPNDLTRSVILVLALHLLVSIAPCLKHGHVQGFWQFNKSLFLRIQTGILYSLVLYAGIAAAISTVNILFGFKFKFEIFLYLWVIIVGMFNTLFFLAGIPNNLQLLDSDLSYPKSLKIFTQYVLIPLATLYVVILLSYEIKILLEWSLPKGKVSGLILGYAVFGLLSMLLVYPIRNQEDNRWIKSYSRFFYLLMLPLLVLLFIAVGERISRYGITPFRYFLVLLAFWLLGVTFYFLLSKKQNIKVIPISLFLLSLLTIYGPQSFADVSKSSQMQVIIRIFKAHGLFQNGRLKPAPGKTLDVDEATTAASSLTYILADYGVEAVTPYLDEQGKSEIKAMEKKRSQYRGTGNARSFDDSKKNLVRNYLGLARYPGNTSSESRDETETTTDAVVKTPYSFKTKYNSLVDVSGYDLLLPEEKITADTVSLSNGNLNIKKIAVSDSVIVLMVNGERAVFDLGKLARSLIVNELDRQAHQGSETGPTAGPIVVPGTLLQVTASTRLYHIELKITQLTLIADSRGRLWDIQYFDGNYLFKKK